MAPDLQPSLSDGATTAAVKAPSKFETLLQDYGLQNADGDGTLLGKGLLTAGMGYAQSEMAENAAETATKVRRKEREHTKELDEKFKQRDLRAFKGTPLFVRNG